MCNNYNYDLSNLVVGRYYPVEGKVCRLMCTKKFDGYTTYQFSDWRLGGGRVYTIYHKQRRLCHGKIVETLSQCEITDKTIIAEYHNNKSRQDRDIAEFYEARPHLNHD